MTLVKILLCQLKENITTRTSSKKIASQYSADESFFYKCSEAKSLGSYLVYGDIHCTHFYYTDSINVALLSRYLSASQFRKFRRPDQDEWSAKMAASLKKSLKITFSNRKLFAEVFLVMSAFNLKSKIFKVVDTNFN